eukprot:4468481-Amphidinium_carterae.1
MASLWTVPVFHCGFQTRDHMSFAVFQGICNDLQGFLEGGDRIDICRTEGLQPLVWGVVLKDRGMSTSPEKQPQFHIHTCNDDVI